MINRNFNDWLSSFRESISDYKYYVDFKKVYKNVDNLKIELNILNSLIGSKNIKKDFDLEHVPTNWTEKMKTVWRYIFLWEEKVNSH